MSYSTKVKAEVIKIQDMNREEIYSEIVAIFRSSGNFVVENGAASFYILTENPAFARRIFSLAKSWYNLTTNIRIVKNKRFRQHNDYIVALDNMDILRDITENMEMEYAGGQHCFFSLPEFITGSEDKKRAYIRGAFLSAGSISNPEKTYHLEIKARDRIIASETASILESFGLNPKILKRSSWHVVYLKESEHIKEFLGIIGAHGMLMEFENIRILKEMRNNVNRLVNCETSNLDKTVNAGVRQAEDIKLIERTRGLASLPQTLREIAELRLENEELSLLELSQLTRNRIGKSGVNHRMKKISKIAEEIREMKGEEIQYSKDR